MFFLILTGSSVSLWKRQTNPMNNVKLHRNIKEVSEKEKEVNICFNNTDKEQQQNIFFLN